MLPILSVVPRIKAMIWITVLCTWEKNSHSLFVKKIGTSLYFNSPQANKEMVFHVNMLLEAYASLPKSTFCCSASA